MKKLFILFVLLFPVIAFAQSDIATIKGNVKMLWNGGKDTLPGIYATITLMKGNQTITGLSTDSTGNFSLTFPYTKDSLIINVSAIGANAQRFPIKLSTIKENTFLFVLGKVFSAEDTLQIEEQAKSV